MTRAALPPDFAKPGTTISVALGREVVRAEAAALLRLADHLDHGFDAAAGLLLGVRGRVVVTGLGKSGHVARKIASTLSATGTPSFFMHAAEAGHGDLGMVVAGDVLLVVSNSGSSPELEPMIERAHALSVATIAITGHPGSPALANVEVCLTVPRLPEADADNVVPTTSSAMAMALGDALAIAVMRLRGKGAGDFHALHPSGTIGARLRPVASLMHTAERLPLARDDESMRRVLLTMNEKGFGIAGVTDAEGRLVGAITDGDLRRHVDDLHTLTARQIMTRDPKVVTPDTTLAAAKDLMADAKITALFVVSVFDRRPVGVVHIHDLLRAGLG